MSNPGSWGKSWLSSWMSSWGRQEDNGRSGWFRLWLIEAQRKANAERESLLVEKTPEVSQGAVEVPKVLARTAKKKGKTAKVITVQEKWNIPPFVSSPVQIPQRLLDQPLPDFSVMEFNKAIDFQKHQQFRKQKQRREEEALILLLAA